MGFQYDYFYSMETRQYKYFVIPQMLVLDEQFSSLSDRAKILYCVMLDRSSMSARSGWIDEHGRVYIIMTRDEIMEKMNCSHTTAHKFMQELIDFGLVKKKRQGQGKPDLIYVMNFNKYAEEGEEALLQEGKDSLLQEGKDSLLQEGKDSLPQEGKKTLPQEGKKTLPLDVKKTCPESDLYNKTNINKSSSSESSDDDYIRQHLGYYQASQKYSPIIVDLLYRELTTRDPTEWSKVNQKTFLALCRNVTDYHGQVANVAAYIARCIDNALVAARANIASPSGRKSKNRFNDFQQNTYDFDALEKKLLENR